MSTIARITKNTVLFPVKRIAGERLPADGSDICPCKGTYRPTEKAEAGVPRADPEEKEDPEDRRLSKLFDRDNDKDE